MRVIGPQRFDQRLRVGQPDSEYGIAIFDVAKGTFTRTIWLDPPWCGVGEIFGAPADRVAVLCPVSHQLRMLDLNLGHEVGRLDVSGVMAAPSPDGRRLWLLSTAGDLEEVDLAQLKVTRRSKLVGSESCSFCLPLQRLHSSIDGLHLYLRAAPNQPDLPPTGRGSRVWIVDTGTLQRVADLPLPDAAFDSTPTPDGGFMMASTMRSEPPTGNATWFIELASGRVIKHWPWSVWCLEIWPQALPARRLDGSGVREVRRQYGLASALGAADGGEHLVGHPLSNPGRFGPSDYARGP
jgi:hypothetical protein